MRVTVRELYEPTDEPWDKIGSEDDLRRSLLARYTSLLPKFGSQAPLHVLVAALNQSQAYIATLQGGDVIFKSEAPGSDYGERCIQAAEFLSGKTYDPVLYRQVLVERDDPEVAALVSCGLLDLVGEDKSPLEDLRAVLSVRSMNKGETKGPERVTVEEVIPATVSAREYAALVKGASSSAHLMTATFGGKHSSGILIAYDATSGTRLMLKPGSGPNSPADGVSETHTSQSKRECAFSAAARIAFGVTEVPRAELLLIDGKEYAAIEMAPSVAQPADTMQRLDGSRYVRLMSMKTIEGKAHWWGLMDYVLGNPDRHSGNLLIDGEDVFLIDHGSALAGEDFDPGNDKNSRIPAYLTYSVPAGFWSGADPLTKSEMLPQVGWKVDSELGNRILGVSEVDITRELERYGIDSKPALQRLNFFKGLVPQEDVGVCEHVNDAWCGVA